MTPSALVSAVGLVTEPVREVLGAGLAEHGFEFDGILWVLSTALIVEALKTARGNKSRAARMLGMERCLLNYQIKARRLEQVVDRALEAVKVAEQLQPGLFSPRAFVLKFFREGVS